MDWHFWSSTIPARIWMGFASLEVTDSAHRPHVLLTYVLTLCADDVLLHRRALLLP